MSINRKNIKDVLHEPLLVRFEPDTVVCRSFMGFGAEWDPGVARLADSQAMFTDEDWDLVVRRIEWMRIPVIRMMMQTKWCYKGGGCYDWESPAMQLLYRHLDVCQKNGITVILTDWGCEREWLSVPEIKDFADPLYAVVIGTYMDYLIRVKGYACIKYFVLGNEPNIEVRNFARWKRGVDQVWDVFAGRGLLNAVGIAGSDESENQAWHRLAVDELQGKLAAYDFHRYAQHNCDPVQDEIRSGHLYELFETEWSYALLRDPQALTKPMIVGEAGISHAGFSFCNNPCHLEFLYGLKMADYAVQAVGAGSWAVSVWMLDDSSHKDFNWGMWSNKENGFALKSWFYPWSLLCRLIPAGSTIYRCASYKSNATSKRFLALSGVSPAPDLRVLGARSNDPQKPGWTIMLVNRSTESMSVKLQTFESSGSQISHYVYAESDAETDKCGFPVAKKNCAGDLVSGVVVKCPPKSVYFVTSI